MSELSYTDKLVSRLHAFVADETKKKDANGKQITLSKALGEVASQTDLQMPTVWNFFYKKAEHKKINAIDKFLNERGYDEG